MPSPAHPDEASFLVDALPTRAWILTRDFVNFSLVLLFYLLCWSVGGAAFMIDNMFRTRLFARFIRLIEYVDNGGA